MSWILGYPAGLKDVASEAAGRALYDGWGYAAISLSSLIPRRVKGTASSNSSGYFNAGQTLVADSLNGGTCRFTNGDHADDFFGITDTTTSLIYVDGTLGSVAGDYFEAVTGECSFSFPTNQDPELFSVRTQVKGVSERLSFNLGGYDVQYGREADSFILRARFKSLNEVTKLFTMLSNPVSYKGNHAILYQEEVAPLVLQDNNSTQYLVHCQDAKLIGDASMGTILTVSVTLSSYVTPLLRGY